MEGNDYQKLIEKIIDSKSFGRSDTYANLLRYLTKCSARNNVPKETTIASDIFGKPEFDPTQSTLVRTYVYNLRKKLKTYYLNEGAKDLRIIRIPRGSYAIEVIERKDEMRKAKTSKKKWLYPLAGLLLLSLGLNFFLAYNGKEMDPMVQSKLWTDLIQSKKSTMLVLGDLFIYQEQDTLNRLVRTIRDPLVNSKTEFEIIKATEERPNIHMEPLTYSHLILGSAQWIKRLTEIFYSIDREYTIRTMSRFNPKQLPDYDLIVVGMQKTLGVFKSYFRNSNFEYDPVDDAFVYRGDEKTNPKTYRPKGNADAYHTDYGLIRKFPGPNSNTIYVFSGIWDTGATQSLKNFTEPSLLTQLEGEMEAALGTIPKYYEVFFEVNGVDRMELSSKILHLNKIDASGEDATIVN